jgi:hypothetical protein
MRRLRLRRGLPDITQTCRDASKTELSSNLVKRGARAGAA